MQCLSHVEFHKAAECLKEHKNDFLDARPSQSAAAKMLTGMVGFYIPVSSIRNLSVATGVSWESRKSPTTHRETEASLTILADSLLNLYRGVGEEPPDDLRVLANVLNRKNGEVSK